MFLYSGFPKKVRADTDQTPGHVLRFRVVKEAKDMASENVEARKHLSVEQERRRSDDRSRAKHDERRRMELERKADDIHALRYRQAFVLFCLYPQFLLHVSVLCFAVSDVYLLTTSAVGNRRIGSK